MGRKPLPSRRPPGCTPRDIDTMSGFFGPIRSASSGPQRTSQQGLVSSMTSNANHDSPEHDFVNPSANTTTTTTTSFPTNVASLTASQVRTILPATRNLHLTAAQEEAYARKCIEMQQRILSINTSNVASSSNLIRRRRGLERILIEKSLLEMRREEQKERDAKTNQFGNGIGAKFAEVSAAADKPEARSEEASKKVKQECKDLDADIEHRVRKKRKTHKG